MSFFNRENIGDDYGNAVGELRDEKDRLEKERDEMKEKVDRMKEEISLLQEQATSAKISEVHLERKRKELEALCAQERILEERIQKTRADIGKMLMEIEKEQKNVTALKEEMEDLEIIDMNNERELGQLRNQVDENDRQIEELTRQVEERRNASRCPCQIM